MLGNALWALGRAEEAIEQLEAALRQRPGWPIAANNLAWMLATAPDPALRDPERAVGLAEETLAVAPQDAGALDTLAAAHAASGRFDRALELARRARDAGDPREAADIEARIALYRQRRPYLERLPRSGEEP